MENNLQHIPISELHGFEDNPFRVTDNEEMSQLIDSIRENGIISPLVVRPDENGGYEIISGHRRKYAGEKAGLETVPAFVRDMDRNTAIITLVDSNLHREHILPSEKAFAYKLKLEAMKHQGKPASRQSVGKSESADSISETESGRQVQRYIRLTYLIPEILQMIDEGKIAFTPAVELSYLSEDEQRDLLEAMDTEDKTPSYSQSVRMKRLSQSGKLDAETIDRIMSEDKPNQVEKMRLPLDKVRGYFPSTYTPKQMEDTIFRLLENWQRQQKRKHDAR